MSILLTIIVVGVLLLGLRYPLLILVALWVSTHTKLMLAYYAPLFQTVDFMVLALVFAVLAFGGHYLLNPQKIRFNWRVGCVFFAMIIFHSISYLWGPETAHSFELLTKGSLIGIAFFLIPFFYIQSEKQADRFLRMVFWVGCILAIGTVFFPNLDNQARGTFLSAVPLSLSYSLGMGILAALTLIIRTDKGQWLRRIYWFGIPVLAAGMFMTGSRGPVLTCGFGVLVFMVLARRQFGFSRWVLMGMFGLMTVIAIIIFVPENHMARIASIFAIYESGDMEGTGRKDLWEIAWTGIKQSPVFGNGLGSFDAKTDLDYPHNIFLDIWNESGISTVLFFILFLVSVSVVSIKRIRLLKNDRNQTIMAGFLAMFLATFLEECKSGGWIDYRYLWLMGGFCISYAMLFVDYDANYSMYAKDSQIS